MKAIKYIGKNGDIVFEENIIGRIFNIEMTEYFNEISLSELGSTEPYATEETFIKMEGRILSGEITNEQLLEMDMVFMLITQEVIDLTST